VVEVDVLDRQTDVVVQVIDNGPGVPRGQEDLIFGREDVDTVHHGTGLGLFLVDSIVSNYDGTVWVEENDPEGAVFAVRLQHASHATVSDDVLDPASDGRMENTPDPISEPADGRVEDASDPISED
jgi:K+-sensing histidine kinase KdpD